MIIFMATVQEAGLAVPRSTHLPNLCTLLLSTVT